MVEVHEMYEFRLRGDTAARWTSINPILSSREPAIETDTGKLKIGDGIRRWSELGYLSGEGAPGEPGKSAYQVALDNGFVGTEVQWLASLVGANGLQGLPGADGATGPKGDQGDQGLPGTDGATGPKGDTGDTGPQGPAGADGIDYTGPTITVASSAPASPAIGDVWIDTSA